jgi:hypothetical protein
MGISTQRDEQYLSSFAITDEVENASRVALAASIGKRVRHASHDGPYLAGLCEPTTPPLNGLTQQIAPWQSIFSVCAVGECAGDVVSKAGCPAIAKIIAAGRPREMVVVNAGASRFADSLAIWGSACELPSAVRWIERKMMEKMKMK